MKIRYPAVEGEREPPAAVTLSIRFLHTELADSALGLSSSVCAKREVERVGASSPLISFNGVITPPTFRVEWWMFCVFIGW